MQYKLGIPKQSGVKMKSKFPGAVPEIPVRDINQAAAYYQHNLGFSLDWGGEEIGLAGISKGHCRMFLANQEFRKEYGNVGPILTWLNLESKDEVNELYRVWSASEAKLMSVPESKPWGLHEFTAADLDGNLFRVFYDFGTPADVRPFKYSKA
jgi:predicted lactoylglutathione lyase